MTRLSTLTSVDVAARGDAAAILAVPVGATEQHGPHLPLTTDTDIAVALVDRLALARPDVVAAPPVPFGSSGEHDGFAGTLSIGQDAVEVLLMELCRSAASTFAAVVLVSAHGGNAEPLRRASRRLTAEGRAILAWSPDWGAAEHAGAAETSIMLALAPELVRLERAVPGDRRPVRELLPRLRAEGVAAVSPNGVLGDPSGSSAQDGLRLLERAADDLATAVAAWRT